MSHLLVCFVAGLFTYKVGRGLGGLKEGDLLETMPELLRVTDETVQAPRYTSSVTSGRKTSEVETIPCVTQCPVMLQSILIHIHTAIFQAFLALCATNNSSRVQRILFYICYRM